MGWEVGLATQEVGELARCTETAHGKGQADEADQRRPQRQHLIAHPIAHADSAPPRRSTRACRAGASSFWIERSWWHL